MRKQNLIGIELNLIFDEQYQTYYLESSSIAGGVSVNVGTVMSTPEQMEDFVLEIVNGKVSEMIESFRAFND